MFWEDTWEWKQVKRFVESDGRMKISVSLDLMVAMASRMDHPPWQFDEEAALWQSQLHDRLGAQGGSSVRWLVHE